MSALPLAKVVAEVDSGDTFMMGVGAIIVGCGFFASLAWNGIADGLFFGNASQLGDQAPAALVTSLYAFGMTYLLLRAMSFFTELRANEHDEAVGMDVVQHGEQAYASGGGAILVLPDADGEALVADPG
jgi:ammonium transporter, Amt family